MLHKYWKFYFITNDSRYNQDSILKFSNKNKLEIVEPVIETKIFELIDDYTLYIGDYPYKEVKDDINSYYNWWIIVLEKQGSGYIEKM